jgi:hypothetical protein
MDIINPQTPLEKYVITLEEEQERLLRYIQKIEKEFNNKFVELEQEREYEIMVFELFILNKGPHYMYHYATLNRIEDKYMKVFKRFGYMYLLYDVLNARHIIAFNPQHRQALLDQDPNALAALKQLTIYQNYNGPFQFELVN